MVGVSGPAPRWRPVLTRPDRPGVRRAAPPTERPRRTRERCGVGPGHRVRYTQRRRGLRHGARRPPRACAAHHAPLRPFRRAAGARRELGGHPDAADSPGDRRAADARRGHHRRRLADLPRLVRRTADRHLPAGRRHLAVPARRRPGDPAARSAALVVPGLVLGDLRHRRRARHGPAGPHRAAQGPGADRRLGLGGRRSAARPDDLQPLRRDRDRDRGGRPAGADPPPGDRRPAARARRHRQDLAAARPHRHPPAAAPGAPGRPRPPRPPRSASCWLRG